MATKKQAQIHMDDQIVNDPELESLLEERQELKVNVSEYIKVNKKAQEKICKIETLGDLTPYVAQSGFKTVQEWYETFLKFGHTTGWLYKVEFLDPADEFKPIEPVEIQPMEGELS